MAGYTLSTTVERPYDEAVGLVRDALAEQGFGVLTEIDVRATMKDRLGVDTPSQVILGACRPSLAHEAMQAEPSIATVLPCNVVVRAVADRSTVVEAFDPDAMSRLVDSSALRTVAADARRRLAAALAALRGADGPVSDVSGSPAAAR